MSAGTQVQGVIPKFFEALAQLGAVLAEADQANEAAVKNLTSYRHSSSAVTVSGALYNTLQCAKREASADDWPISSPEPAADSPIRALKRFIP